MAKNRKKNKKKGEEETHCIIELDPALDNLFTAARNHRHLHLLRIHKPKWLFLFFFNFLFFFSDQRGKER